MEAAADGDEALGLWCRRQLVRYNRRFALPLAIISWLNLVVLLGAISVTLYAMASRQMVMPPLLIQGIGISIGLIWLALPLALFVAHSGFRAMQPPPELAICMTPADIYSGMLREGRRSLLRLPFQLLLPALLVRLLQPLMFDMLRSRFDTFSLLEGLISSLSLLCSAYVLAEIQLALSIRLAPRDENRLLLAAPGIVFLAMALFSAERVFGYWGSRPPLFSEPGNEALPLVMFVLVLAGSLGGLLVLERAFSRVRRALLAAPFALAFLGQALGLALYSDDVVLARLASPASAVLRSFCPGNPRAGWASSDIEEITDGPLAAHYESRPGEQGTAGIEISPGLGVPWLAGIAWFAFYYVFSIVYLRRALRQPPQGYRAIWED